MKKNCTHDAAGREGEWAVFLDVQVRVHRGMLHTRVNHKPTASFSCLHWGSSHPLTQREAVPAGLFRRARLICSSRKAYHKEKCMLADRLFHRGHPMHTIKTAWRRADNLDRAQMLAPRAQIALDFAIPPSSNKSRKVDLVNPVQPDSSERWYG